MVRRERQSLIEEEKCSISTTQLAFEELKSARTTNASTSNLESQAEKNGSKESPEQGIHPERCSLMSLDRVLHSRVERGIERQKESTSQWAIAQVSSLNGKFHSVEHREPTGEEDILQEAGQWYITWPYQGRECKAWLHEVAGTCDAVSEYEVRANFAVESLIDSIK